MTTSNIPDGVSFKDLQDLAENAKEADAPTFGEQELTRDQMLQAVEDMFDNSMEVCNDPMFHKLLVMKCVSNFIQWHTNVGSDNFDSEDMNGVHWLRDAGKFQAMMDIMCAINVGHDDFVTPAD